ncbi:uncharacterized protein LOC132727520 [Ruditapes philippinarum]|uniref:uncharacterized protein LOC132727520 n=1 Tax=Ruditapes philippinarum TaxID=129788 RepID=UPI00295B7E4E|nr:uncharacterized protein LOC132727520 [Ruditapes philippinarum]
MLGLKLITLGLTVTTAFCCSWGSWGSCSYSCGGGSRSRNGRCGLWGWHHTSQSGRCNEFCYNGGWYYSDSCHCNAWRTGRCCQVCRHVYIAHCKPGKQACGGSPDNIKCTECDVNYVPAGYGNGCKTCAHRYLIDGGVPRCTCFPGYLLSSNGYSCYDVDECAYGISNCDQICTNTHGSFQCSCRPGFRLNVDGHTCSDIDECLSGEANCKQNCINTPGSFQCVCHPGYTLSTDGFCKDINECSANNGGCMQTCVNKPGSFNCECRDGYRLEADQMSCIDIDECLGVTCKNGGSCFNNVGSFTCSCIKGFTGMHCEQDVNECEGFLRGGCTDRCINTHGSFRCECSGNTTLNSDGMSCSGGENKPSVFVQHRITRQLLPKGCFTILLTRCTDGETVDVLMSSTSPWFQLRSNNAIKYTFGIVFVEVNTLYLPVSLTGIRVEQSSNNFAIVTGSLALHDIDGVAIGNERKVDCFSFTTTPRDIHDFLMSSSFLKSVFNSLENILPDWLRFSQTGTDILSINDLQTELLRGNEIQTGPCQGAPLYEHHLYTVLKFGSSFSINLYGDEILIPRLNKNTQFCLIIDICQHYGGSWFLIIPDESRDIFKNFRMIDIFRQSYGLDVRPYGIGLSLLNLINVPNHGKSHKLWRGDSYFNYQVLPTANLWADVDTVWATNGDTFSFELRTRSDIFIKTPSIESVFTSMFFNEWDAYLDMNLYATLDIKFDLFGKKHVINLQNIGAGAATAIASIGGQMQREWCGINANPPGLYMSLTVDVNPFRDIPILKNGFFDINNLVYAFIATDPSQTSSNGDHINILQEIVNLKETANKFVNTTIKNVASNISLLFNESVETFGHLMSSAEYLVINLDKLVHELYDSSEIIFTNLVKNVSDIWRNGYKPLRKNAEKFLDSIEHNSANAIHDFASPIEHAISQLKAQIGSPIITLFSQIKDLYNNPVGFGIRYKGSLEVFFIKIVGLEIELVYSVNQLGKCDRFKKLYELLKCERALRIYGVISSGLIKVLPFIRMDVGAGIGVAISFDSPSKVIGQLHAEASVLGITLNCDIFLTPTGHYFFLQGKIWNTFMAELKVSFESNESGVKTFEVLGRFVANAGEGDSFQDSYLDGIRKITQKIADETDRRISQVQNAISTAQNALSKAQEWLENKKAIIYSANKAFDRAVQALEYAKDRLEAAKIPFRNALSVLNEAQRKVDSLCKIRTCRRICIPGISCRICRYRVWGLKIHFPCCRFTNCMLSFPDPFCVLYNLGCMAIRSIAYIALEAAKFFVRIPMAALDAAKLLVSAAQFAVDKSRVVLDIAVGALELAQIGLEASKFVLEGAKLALEAVKQVVNWGIKVINFIIEYGIQSIIDVKNCGFGIKFSTKQATVFHVECYINLFRQGFRKVRIGINFGSPLQSIWQAAKGTIDTFADFSQRESDRKKREVKYKALSGLHSVIRKVRNADSTSEDFDGFVNDTIDTVFNTNGFKRNVSAGDYENRVELFQEKCSIMNNVIAFFSEAIHVLFEMTNETTNSLTNASSIEESLEEFNIDDIASNFSVDTVGINTDEAMSNFNISVDDINIVMQKTKENMTNDPLLLGIGNLTKEAKTVLKNQTKDANSVNIINHWIQAMENATFEYFTNDSCVSFLDCAHFAVSQMYGLFDAENVPNMSQSLDAISRFEDNILDLLGNTTYTIIEVYNLTAEIQRTLDEINNYDVFCSEPPKLLSQLGNYNVTKGSTLQLFCNVTGNPKPKIWWYRSDEHLPNQNNQLLELYAVTKLDENKYHCVAGNLIANLTSEYGEVFVYENSLEVHTSNNSTRQNDFIDGNMNESTDSGSLVIILGTTFGVLLFIVGVGAGFAARLHIRKRSRKKNGLTSLTSLNMVRPSGSKPKFNTNLVAYEASSE